MSTLEDNKDYINSLFKEEHMGIDDGVFYFETDFLALKGNRDYLKLIKTLAVLNSQRIKISQDIEKLEALKAKVEFAPESVKEEILSAKSDFINRLKIATLPEIDWSKYKRMDFRAKNLKTRRMAKQPSQPVETTIKQEQENEKQIRIRGRVYNEKKPETFNQLWTVEEQLRLEQLLIEFPPEPIENRRWKKIAEALGNRTTKQVCSRVQKYFQKLQKAGLSYPRRNAPKNLKAAHVHRKHKHLLYKPTTFFPGVAMAELESESDEDMSAKDDDLDLSHWKEILEKIEEERNQKAEGEEMVHHYGYKCKFCEDQPIVGIRWVCNSCPETYSCSECLANLRDELQPRHAFNHKFTPITEFINPYYNSKAFGSDNYLDPNFENPGIR